MGIRLGVVLTLLVLAGCGDDGSSRTGRPTLDLDGTSWIATRVTENGADRPLVPGTSVRVEFSHGAIDVDTGCNNLGGDYTLTGDRLGFGQLTGTLMGCDQPRTEQEAWLRQTVLAAPLTATRAGDTLTLSRAGLEIVLTDRRIASPDAPLQGTAWQLDGISDGDAISSVPQGVRRPTLTIAQDGTVTLHTGCNSGGSTATVAGSTITLGPVVTTKMACADEAGQQTERSVLAVLDGSVTWSVREHTLTLTKGDHGLVYRVAP